ncbi:MFS transporter [Paenibacillus sp. CAU 1782]
MSKTESASKTITSGMIILLAAACGLIVANLYYAQTLIGPIGADTGLSHSASGLIVTLTQIGYVAGLLFIVPLSDMVENRILVAASLALAVMALLGAAWSPNAALFLLSSLLIGLGSVVAQVLVPFASYLAPEDQRGRVVGKVMSGLLLGIMLARPVASLVADAWGWRTLFMGSAAVSALLAVFLISALPARQPAAGGSYGKLLASLLVLLKKTPVLRQRALYQACLFGAFSLFWTAAPLYLADVYGMSQKGIALFALVGVGGAVAAPIMGRYADKGLIRPLTFAALLTAVLSFAVPALFPGGSSFGLILLFVGAILLDMAVSGNLVLSQQAIYSLGSEARGRLNGLFMAIFFIGGALGSFLGGWSYAQGGWGLSVWVGCAMPLLALLLFLSERPNKGE